MINKKPLIIAGIMGLIAVALVFGYLKKYESDHQAVEIEYGKVVVAQTQIPVRTKVKEPMLDEVIVPLDAIHPDAVTEMDEILGKVTNQVIFESEQILSAKFEDAENLRELAFIIEEGMRGVSIGVSDVKSLGGNVMPGDHVDVVGVFKESITGIDSAFTILTDVSIKAVGKSLGPEDEQESGKGSARTVTLEVTPQQAEKLILADENGNLRLTLRHPDEIYTPKSVGTHIYQVVEYFDPPNRDKVVAAAPLPEYPEYFANTPEPEDEGDIEFDFDTFSPVERVTVQIIMGGEVSEVVIEKPIVWN